MKIPLNPIKDGEMMVLPHDFPSSKPFFSLDLTLGEASPRTGVDFHRDCVHGTGLRHDDKRLPVNMVKMVKLKMFFLDIFSKTVFSQENLSPNAN